MVATRLEFTGDISGVQIDGTPAQPDDRTLSRGARIQLGGTMLIIRPQQLQGPKRCFSPEDFHRGLQGSAEAKESEEGVDLDALTTIAGGSGLRAYKSGCCSIDATARTGSTQCPFNGSGSWGGAGARFKIITAEASFWHGMLALDGTNERSKRVESGRAAVWRQSP
jgi:hypothetical protein